MGYIYSIYPLLIHGVVIRVTRGVKGYTRFVAFRLI